MRCSKRFAAVMCVLLSAFVPALGSQRSAPADTAGWNPAAAAHYLDGRAEWWTTWPNATRDSGTYCMSCHTTLPVRSGEAGPAITGRRVRTVSRRREDSRQSLASGSQLARRGAVVSGSDPAASPRPASLEQSKRL